MMDNCTLPNPRHQVFGKEWKKKLFYIGKKKRLSITHISVASKKFQQR
jgi:hypothetical protein